MIEYAISKSSLEIISNGLMKIYKNILILNPRLGRVKTAQTLSVIKGLQLKKQLKIATQ